MMCAPVSSTLEIMKTKLKEAIGLSIVCGWIGYEIFEFSYSLPTSDWAAKGVPILERLYNTTLHGLPGIAYGMIIGFIIGLIIPQKILSDLPDSETEKVLSWRMKVILLVLSLGIIFAYFHFLDPTILTVTINFFILMAVYYLATQIFGEPAQRNKNENF